MTNQIEHSLHCETIKAMHISRFQKDGNVIKTVHSMQAYVGQRNLNRPKGDTVNC